MNRPPPRPTIPGAAFLLAAALLMPLCPPASAEEDPPPPDTLRPGDALLVRIENLGGHQSAVEPRPENRTPHQCRRQ